MNSARTRSLQNTCGGIQEMQTFKTPIRVLVRRDADGEGEHLELVFGENADEPADGEDIIKANRAYGRVPSSLFEK